MRARWLAGVAGGLLLGLGTVVAIEAATPDASAQSGFTVSPSQLRVNQRISQAAVRRSNEALNLLRPLRPAPGQQATGARLDQAGGVQPGTGTGWQPGQIDIAALQSALQGSGQNAAGPQAPAEPAEVVRADNGATPDPLPANQFGAERTLFAVPVTTTRSGRLLVDYHANVAGQCASASNYWAWLTLDDSPIPSSARLLRAATGDEYPPLNLRGVTDAAIAPGQHSITFAGACASGTTSHRTLLPRHSTVVVSVLE